MLSSIALFPLFLFFRRGSNLRTLYIPFETLEDNLAHGLALQGGLRLDLDPQSYANVSQDLRFGVKSLFLTLS